MKRNLKYTYWGSGALFLLVFVMAAWGASRAFMSDLVRQNMQSLGQTFATVSPKLFLILILFLFIFCRFFVDNIVCNIHVIVGL